MAMFSGIYQQNNYDIWVCLQMEYTHHIKATIKLWDTIFSGKVMIVIVIVDVGSPPSPMRFPEHPNLQESHLAAATQIRQGSVYIVLYI